MSSNEFVVVVVVVVVVGVGVATHGGCTTGGLCRSRGESNPVDGFDGLDLPDVTPPGRRLGDNMLPKRVIALPIV